MKILIVFFSRTGHTRKVAEKLQSEFRCDLEELHDEKKRTGFWGYFFSGRDAMQKRAAKLAAMKYNPADYELVILGTPIWAFDVCTPIRTYLSEHKKVLKKAAFFCTMGGSGDQRAFSSMKKLCEQEPIASLSVLQKEVEQDLYQEKLANFAKKLR